MAGKRNGGYVRVVRLEVLVVIVDFDVWRGRFERISEFRHCDTAGDVNFVGQIGVSCDAQVEEYAVASDVVV